METDTAFVRANGIVMLDTVAHVVLDFAAVVYPTYTEREDAVGNTETFNEVVTLEFGIFIVGVLNRSYYFFNSLDVFRLVGKTPLKVGDDFRCFHFESDICLTMEDSPSDVAKLYCLFGSCNNLQEKMQKCLQFVISHLLYMEACILFLKNLRGVV